MYPWWGSTCGVVQPWPPPPFALPGRLRQVTGRCGMADRGGLSTAMLGAPTLARG